MIPLLAAQDPHSFPAVHRALRRPNGLLAAGGDLSPERLLSAYQRGIFPWFGDGDPILWWSPDPRTILPPSQIRISRSLRKRLRRRLLGVTMDRSFAEVIRACSAPREPESGGTWIVPQMIRAYEALHRLGWAHSVEVWQEERLVGGLYGVAVGRVFFGESMFSQVDDASKVALVHLCERLQAWDFGLIDCQMRTDHLISLGALEIPRPQFVTLLELHCALPGRRGSWDQGDLQFPGGPAPVRRTECDL
jgi:leucyl/phenylalanyl-tRNA---protein transferase